MKRICTVMAACLFICLAMNLQAQKPDCDPPVINCPPVPFELTICGQGWVCVEMPVKNASKVDAGPATFAKGSDQLCFHVDSSGTYVFTIIATNECGADTCQITAIVNMKQKPQIQCPLMAFDTIVCEVQEICLELPIVDAQNVSVAGATWENDKLCFMADSSGNYTLNVVASNGCGSTQCEINYVVQILPAPVITCPAVPQDFVQCDDWGVVADLPIANATDVIITGGDAVWRDGKLYFDVVSNGLYSFNIIAENRCGADTCDYSANVTVISKPMISCPMEPLQKFLCAPAQVCIELPIQNAGIVTVNGATWVDDELCFEADISDMYTFTIVAANVCGADTCTVNVQVQIGAPPIITCPASPIDTNICAGSYFYIPIPIQNPDQVEVTGAEWIHDSLKFLADSSGTKSARVIASNACGVDTCDITIHLTVIQYPQVCFKIDSATQGLVPAVVYFGNCTPPSGSLTYLWDFGDGSFSTEFAPSHAYDTNGCYNISLTGVNECGTSTLTKFDYVCITDAQVVIPTNEWINIYCETPTLDDEPLQPGDIISAYDPQGILCGMGRVREDGSYGFIPIYRDDPYTTPDDGALPGDLISIKINFNPVFAEPTIVWEENGDRTEVCQFFTGNCRQMHLNEGWNLISWNIAYEAEIEQLLAQLGDCVEIVLSFDQSGLTYNPQLPQYSTLHQVDYYHGYWFKMSCPADFEICGAPIARNTLLPVYKGWNLVPYWPEMIIPIEAALPTIIDDLLVALGYKDGGLTWLPGMNGFNTLTQLEPGLGYWLKLAIDNLLIYPGFSVPEPLTVGTKRPIPTAQIEPSTDWISVYGSKITVDGIEIEFNSVVDLYTKAGVMCGSSRYGNGILKFTPVYGYGNSGGISSSYPKVGEAVQIHINGNAVYPEIIWRANGDCIDISALFTKPNGTTPVLPEQYALSQNYPNPFNPETSISIDLPTASQVELSVFNLLGQKVATLANGYYPAGKFEVRWDATDQNGQKVSSGIYLYRIQAGDFTQTRKMILAK